MEKGTVEFVIEGEERKGHRPIVYWYPSFRCNLACKHCWVDSSPQVDTSNDLTTEQALQVVDQLRELNVSEVIFSGGEALYRPDILTILQATLDAGVNIGLESNGLCFTKEFTDIVKRGGKNGASLGMTVSLDGGTPETHNFLRGSHTFERTMKGLQFLCDEGVKFDVQCVVNKTNIDSIPALFETVAPMRPWLGALLFAFLHPVGRGEGLTHQIGMRRADYEAAYAHISEHAAKYDFPVYVKVPPALIPPKYMTKLFAGANPVAGCVTSCAFPTLGVLNNGSISICALTRKDDTVQFGNVKTDRLLDVWKRTRMDILRQEYVSGKLTGICGECRFRLTCKGGCRAYAYDQMGDFGAPHPLCHELEQNGEFPEVYRNSPPGKATPKKAPRTYLPLVSS